MGSDLVPAGEATAKSLEKAADAAAGFIAASRSASTRRAYASDWRDFSAWSAGHGLSDNPAMPGSVASYIAALAQAGAKLATIRRRCSAIADAHRRVGNDSPTAHPGVRATLEGITRTIGSAPVKKTALTAELLAKAARRIPANISGLRDRALLAIGFAAALRRSELVGLDVSDIQRHPKGIVVTIRRSKTDQAGAGTIKAVPFGRKLRAVAALDAWLSAARITEGPVFRPIAKGGRIRPFRLSDRAVALIVQRRVVAIGLDPKLFAAHSLRSGFITTASDHGASLLSIAEHAKHAKLDTTRTYVQVADAFRDHSGKGFL